MKNPVLEIAEKEYRRWKAELERTAAYQNMSEWADVIIAKGGILPEKSADIHKGDAAKPKKIANTGVSKYGDQKRRIRELTKEHIAMKGGNAPIDSIYDYWIANGLKVKRDRASAYLSEQKGVFVSDRKRGWSVRDSEISPVVYGGAEGTAGSGFQ